MIDQVIMRLVQMEIIEIHENLNISSIRIRNQLCEVGCQLISFFEILPIFIDRHKQHDARVVSIASGNRKEGGLVAV